ncbi:endonuclease/exonuclease/phosphatase family protein [Streptomyces melanogenes]|uniref:endonuclease/exonuclease/phosphatase family protein n=1 Tax=Streptomyces melanogenes TaxID=67326 RepID=UPI00379AA934
MQGERDGLGGRPETRWSTAIQQMLNTDGVELAALQEAGNAPPPSSTWTDRRFPNGGGVTEHLWNTGTRDRPDIVNIYWADPGQQRNGLAFVTRDTVRDAVQLPVHSRFNSRPMLGVQIGNDWYFTAHALSNGRDRPNDAEDIIETARQFIAGRGLGEDWMVLGDFNRNPARMPANLQNHIVAADAPTHQGGGELDFAYTNTGNQTTVNAERRGVNSDHFFVRYALDPNCGRPGGLAARATNAKARECDAPVPGQTYRFFSRHLDNALIANVDAKGKSIGPFLKKPTGGKGETLQVRFSSTRGAYLLVFEDGWCLTRAPAPEPAVEFGCTFEGKEVPAARWRFLKGQIVTPDLGGVLQPSTNRVGARVAPTTGTYQWRAEQVEMSPAPEPASPPAPAPGQPPAPGPGQPRPVEKGKEQVK